MFPSPYSNLILSILTFQTCLNGKNMIWSHFFILYHYPQFVPKKYVNFFLLRQKLTPLLENQGFQYCIFSEILEKEHFQIVNPEKNYNTMTYPTFVLYGNTNGQHQN